MKSAALTGLKKIEIRDCLIPDLHANQVLIRIKSVGICGSDLHLYRHGRIGSNKLNYPHVLGHECAGIIEKVGIDTKNWRPGQRVAVEPAIPCETCEFCLRGLRHICPDVLFMGTSRIPGGLQEYIAMPARNALTLPDRLSFDEGVMVEILAICLHALHLISIRKKMVVGILGCGPVGLLLLQAVQYQGLEKIFCTDRLDFRLAIAKKIGARQILSDASDSPVSQILDFTGKQGADLIFECCGSQLAIDLAQRTLKPGGTLVIIGIPETDQITLDPHLIRRKELKIINVRRSNNTTAEAIAWIAQKKIQCGSLISHHFPLSTTAQAFQILDTYADNAVKIIIHP